MTDEAVAPRDVPAGAEAGRERTGQPAPADPAAPAADGGFTSRYGLVRLKQGRRLAGVCAAIGRATNTDPVLWRVLLAVLGFFGGIGILVYLAAWLVIPAEGDTASPVESMLGRGRSSMSPATVIVLGVLVAVMFGFIVTDKFRAVLLGAAILVGGALLLNRDPAGAATHQGRPSNPPPRDPQPVPAAQMPAPADTGPSRPTAAPPAPSTVFLPAPSTVFPPAPSTPPVPGPPLWPGPGQFHRSFDHPSTAAGYRLPFAPHGPYTRPYDSYPPPSAPRPPAPPRPPGPPRERSPLGAAVLSMIFVAIGVVAALDLALPGIQVSAYFAAVLVTIGVGLLVGAWFGRARWLIALGLVVAAALGVATLVEAELPDPGEIVWAPAGHAVLARRYATPVGAATLDLTDVDFAGQRAEVTAEVGVGTLTVIVPPDVDVVVDARVNVGNARVFGQSWGGFGRPPRKVTDVGADGPGGGLLRLHAKVNGDLKVYR